MGSSQCRKVRLIAKVRGYTDLEAESVPWVSVNKPKGEASETVTISFGDQSASRKDSYEMDYCYEQNEGNDIVFSSEVKPLISGVFDGHKATIIASGARGSGKTYVIQGSDEEPGLVVLAMAEILLMAEEKGKLISVSFYEIFQDHVYDLLNPKRPEVLVLEDAQGKIQLKGLSQVPVTSISDFKKLYLSGHNSRKSVQKVPTEVPRRSHKGLMVHVSSHKEKSDTLPVGKMNFVDLAGYEDSRRKSTDGRNLTENTKISKSIYALQNVVYALNTNESRVPYRESKLTRMLQDSLGGTSRTLMVTCLSPSFCQDSMYMLSLASRSCHVIDRAVSDSTKKTKSSARPMVLSSPKRGIPGSVSTTVKKQTGPRVQAFEKKTNGVASAMKGRKLFDDASRLTKSQKASTVLDIVSTIKPSVQEEEKSTSDVVITSAPLEVASTVLDIVSTIEPSVQEEEESISDVVIKRIPLEVEASSLAVVDAWENTIPDKDVFVHGNDDHEDVIPSDNSRTKALFFVEEGQNIDKENNSSVVNEGGSPPISARLQELSNNMKLLYSSTPCIEMPQKNDLLFSGQACIDIAEPKTPEQSMQANDKWEVASISNPWETFYMQSSGMKNSLVQEYLKVLNTASKEELKRLKGIGEKRATYILQLREESPEPFKNLDNLKDIGLSAKQIKGMMKKEVGELFN